MRALLLFLPLCSLAAQQATVPGIAVDGVTGLPLEGVAISFKGEMARSGLTFHQNQRAMKIRVRRHPAGSLLARSKPRRVPPVGGSERVCSGRSKRLRREIELETGPASRISGTFLEDEERPAASCEVDLLEVHELGGLGLFKPIASTACKANGRFAIANVLTATIICRRGPPGRTVPASPPASRRT